MGQNRLSTEELFSLLFQTSSLPLFLEEKGSVITLPVFLCALSKTKCLSISYSAPDWKNHSGTSFSAEEEPHQGIRYYSLLLGFRYR